MTGVPAEVVERWRAQSVDPTERQRRWHTKKEHTQPFETCWHCGRQQAICKSKVRYDSLEAAQANCDEVNYPSRDQLLLPYWCYWTPGMHWHVTSAHTPARKSKARKRMARLYARTA